jgi:hypothetical protein
MKKCALRKNLLSFFQILTNKKFVLILSIFYFRGKEEKFRQDEEN